MTQSIQISPVERPVTGRIRPPGSKSITNRALICAALADGTSVVHGALESEDTQVMIDGLCGLGIGIEAEKDSQTLQVAGCGGKIPKKSAEIFVGNSGTTIRFLTALVTLGNGEYRLDGVARMRERPIHDLAEALTQLGANVICEGGDGCPPVLVRAAGLKGGKARIKGDISSQFLSGLLMAAPCAERDVILEVVGTLVSVPYVVMTLGVMQSFGVEPTTSRDYKEMTISTGEAYSPCIYQVEPDASAASYFWAAAAVTGGRVTVEGLHAKSLQGDVEFVGCLERMGCRVKYDADAITVIGEELHGIDVDMNAISDTVQTLAVVALFADSPTRIRNVAHIRHKETDRIAAIACELRKLGAKVQEFSDGVEIHPGTFRPATIETYNDHRMAMSFAIAGLREKGVVIQNPSCTAKTYPHFFADLEQLLGRTQGK